MKRVAAVLCVVVLMLQLFLPFRAFADDGGNTPPPGVALAFGQASLVFEAGGSGQSCTMPVTLSGSQVASATDLQAVSGNPLFAASVSGAGSSYTVTVTTTGSVTPQDTATVTVTVLDALSMPMAVDAFGVAVQPRAPADLAVTPE
ncbi:hypothetical protein LJC64_03080, partial [Ruminococcaceae bacterium OttesenSCG-928-A11]|nr:hypothetical protein [Ruminococcaceae bacterium OttesenSCG-928-A11]